MHVKHWEGQGLTDVASKETTLFRVTEFITYIGIEMRASGSPSSLCSLFYMPQGDTETEEAR